MKILSINTFTNKRLSKLISSYIMKGSKKFGIKVNNRKTIFHIKIL